MENFEKRVNVFFYTKRNRHAINKRQKRDGFYNHLMETRVFTKKVHQDIEQWMFDQRHISASTDNDLCIMDLDIRKIHDMYDRARKSA